jgi:hypothetical protein
MVMMYTFTGMTGNEDDWNENFLYLHCSLFLLPKGGFLVSCKI